MKNKESVNLYPSVVERKLLNLLKNNYPKLLIFRQMILSKRSFNFLTSLLRFYPEEVLEISKNFSNLKVSKYSTKWIKVELRGRNLKSIKVI